MEDNYRMVFCTYPDEESPIALSEEVIKKKLAACVNLIPQLTSIYSWENKIQKTKEVLLIIKTTREAYLTLETFLTKTHPYQCPEIIAVPIIQGLKGYLQWVNDTVSNTN